MGSSIAGMFLLSALVTFGQETSPSPQTADRSGVTIEEVIVTGSNIPTSEEVGPNPVDTYRKDDITRLGVRSATDLIQKLPAATGAAINENNVAAGDTVDLNTIPLGLIDHIDVLKDGASAIYGADAVAG